MDDLVGGTSGSALPGGEAPVAASPGTAASPATGAPQPATGGERPGDNICPYLRVPGSGWRAVDPRREHRCTAVEPPIPVTPEKQRRLCLASDHIACPLFQDARDRRASALADIGLSEAALAATRSRPLVRTAPLVLEGRSPGSAEDSWIASRIVQAAIGLLAFAAIVAFIGARLIGAGGAPSATPSATTAAIGPGASETPVVIETAAPSELLPSPELTSAPETLPATPPPATALPTAAPSAVPTPGATEVAARTYTVKKGDTLFAIAQRFDTTVAAIVKLNAIKDPSLIHAGQVLKIP